MKKNPSDRESTKRWFGASTGNWTLDHHHPDASTAKSHHSTATSAKLHTRTKHTSGEEDKDHLESAFVKNASTKFSDS